MLSTPSQSGPAILLHISRKPPKTLPYLYSLPPPILRLHQLPLHIWQDHIRVTRGASQEEEENFEVFLWPAVSTRPIPQAFLALQRIHTVMKIRIQTTSPGSSRRGAHIGLFLCLIHEFCIDTSNFFPYRRQGRGGRGQNWQQGSNNSDGVSKRWEKGAPRPLLKQDHPPIKDPKK